MFADRDVALKDGEFEFALTDATSALVGNKVKNDASGKVVFDKLTFDTAGVYEYLISEVEETDREDGITVDETKYPVTITVTDNGNGNLVAEVKVDGNVVTGSTADVVVFENSYDSADNGGVYVDGVITWDLEVEAGETVTVSFKVTVDAIDEATEDATIANKATIIEGSNTYITNEVTNPIEKVESELEPQPEPEPEPEFKPELKPEPEPETKPEPKPESPKTGDASNPFLWFALMFVSGGTAFAAGRKLKRLNK